MIDDLTTQNKRLKRKLQEHDARYEKDSLFEVRFHGLSSRKRKEFEELLRNFVSNAHDNSSSDDLSQNTTSRTSNTSSFRDYSELPSSGSASTPDARLHDSGYYSFTKSGQLSESSKRPRTDLGQGQISEGQNVEKFIQDIPGPPIQHQPAAFSDRQKKKLVVKRLEDLFTGKSAVNHLRGLSQSMQQQEVSKSAAQYDQTEEGQATSHIEGVREAHILPHDMKADATRRLPGSNSNRTSDDSLPCTDDEDSSLEQRPTRPLDLDPDRAQIPSDNVEYIRHLGLSTPQLAGANMADEQPDAAGWIYLNLLVNMAQLHTINVTPDFVKSAVAEVSDKFQISRDGQKLRWKGGDEGTRLSTESGESSARNQSSLDSDGVGSSSGDRPGKARVERFANIPIKRSTTGGSATGSSKGQFHYTPVFNHHSAWSSSSDIASSIAGSHTSSTASSRGHMLGLRRSSRPHLQSRKSGRDGRVRKRRHTGAVVFYNGAQFFTDYCGDKPLRNRTSAEQTVTKSTYILGCQSRVRPPSSRVSSDSSVPQRPFRDYSKIPPFSQTSPQSPQVTHNDEMDFEFSPKWSNSVSTPKVESLPFNASGLNNVQPADHFVLKVETRRTIFQDDYTNVPAFSKPNSAFIQSSSIQEYRRFSRLYHRRKNPAALPVKTSYTAYTYTPLEPSPLPLPSNAFSSSDSSSADGSNDGSLSQRQSPTRKGLLFQSLRIESPVDSGNVEDDEGGDEDDDESIDMLASARLNDPKIAEMEAEFDEMEKEHLRSKGR